jgi:hypothetical protein
MTRAKSTHLKIAFEEALAAGEIQIADQILQKLLQSGRFKIQPQAAYDYIHDLKFKVFTRHGCEDQRDYLGQVMNERFKLNEDFRLNYNLKPELAA